ncbi:glutaredoxin domain-containing protein [Dermabacteraceae bacterium P7074]
MKNPKDENLSQAGHERWMSSSLYIGVAAVGIMMLFQGSQWPLGLMLAVVGGGLAYWNSPYRGGNHTPFAEAIKRRSSDHAIIFWRPGCPYCARLQTAIRGEKPHITWVNIWRDKDAAAFLRSLNDGNETVPTAVVGEQVLVNPAFSDINRALDLAQPKSPGKN